jgi:glucose/arabinose dehydrogenase
MTRRLGTCLAVLLLAAVPVSAEAKIKLKRIGKFSQPVYVEDAPGTGGIFVVEKGGRIKLLQGGRERLFLNISGLVQAGGEQGLLSVAFPPDYATTRLFYVYFTNNQGNQTIAEVRASADGLNADAGTLRQVLEVPHPNHTNHDGGQLQFGPDGLLYIGTGDGGGAGDGPDNAQSTNSLLGKILRIDPRVQGTQPYTSPPTNPFISDPGRDEIYALGLRNPFRFSFDLTSSPGTPRMVIGDVGQDRFEEIDYETVAGTNGANFGWNDFEGFAPFPGAHSPGPNRHDRPIKVYSLAGSKCALIGGYVVSNRALKGLRGRYLYGDFCAGKVRSLIPGLGGARRDRGTGVTVPMLSSFGEAQGGAIFATSLRGPVYRLKRGK